MRWVGGVWLRQMQQTRLWPGCFDFDVSFIPCLALGWGGVKCCVVGLVYEGEVSCGSRFCNGSLPPSQSQSVASLTPLVFPCPSRQVAEQLRRKLASTHRFQSSTYPRPPVMAEDGHYSWHCDSQSGPPDADFDSLWDHTASFTTPSMPALAAAAAAPAVGDKAEGDGSLGNVTASLPPLAPSHAPPLDGKDRGQEGVEAALQGTGSSDGHPGMGALARQASTSIGPEGVVRVADEHAGNSLQQSQVGPHTHTRTQTHKHTAVKHAGLLVLHTKVACTSDACAHKCWWEGGSITCHS